MTQMLITPTTTRPATVLADEPRDRFFDDGTAILADFPGSTPPEIGDRVGIRRTMPTRRGAVIRKPRIYRVDRVLTREVPAVENGVSYVTDQTTVWLTKERP